MNLLLQHDTALIQLSTHGATIEGNGPSVELHGPFLRLMSDMQTALEVHAEELDKIAREQGE